MAMETVSEALRRLASAGYTATYRADARGLEDLASGRVDPPEAFRVDEVVRFEGESDPADESAVFALALDTETHSAKGTYTVGYGSLMDSLDADMVRRIGGGS